MQKGANQQQTVQTTPPSRFASKSVFAAVLFSLVWLLLRYTPSTRPTAPAMASVPRPNGGVSVGYFTNWGIYARGYKPESIPVADLTHLLYGLFLPLIASNSDRPRQLTRSCESCSFCRRQGRWGGRFDGCLGRRTGKSMLAAEDTETARCRAPSEGC